MAVFKIRSEGSYEIMSSQVAFRPTGELRHFAQRPDRKSLGIFRERDRDNPSVGVGEDVMASCDAFENESVLEEGFGESASGYTTLQTVTTTAEDSIS